MPAGITDWMIPATLTPVMSFDVEAGMVTIDLDSVAIIDIADTPKIKLQKVHQVVRFSDDYMVFHSVIKNKYINDKTMRITAKNMD